MNFVKKPSEKAHKIFWSMYLLMKAESMSLTELSNKSNVSRTTLAGWWHGRASPTIRDLEAVLNVFECTIKMSPIYQPIPLKGTHGKEIKRRNGQKKRLLIREKDMQNSLPVHKLRRRRYNVLAVSDVGRKGNDPEPQG